VTEQEALAKMIAPGTRRPSKYREGVIQILVTRACDKSCFNCTQGSQLAGNPNFMSKDQFRQAVRSLDGYFGVFGVFGGNPALHPQFAELCEILAHYVPYEQRGIWCNNPLTVDKARIMAQVFNPAVSNLNVHLDPTAYAMFKQGWPECNPVGLAQDSRHSPPFVAMKDVIDDEGEQWRLISECDINKHWSAGIGVFRGELRAWFCEIAMAQSILHQDDPEYPDTGRDPSWTYLKMENGSERECKWWELSMFEFTHQVRKHCHDCGIPLRGYGELAQSVEGKEQVSVTHQANYTPKRKGRAVELVTTQDQLKQGKIDSVVKYIQNSTK
jgi:hypothetical protein